MPHPRAEPPQAAAPPESQAGRRGGSLAPAVLAVIAAALAFPAAASGGGLDARAFSFGIGGGVSVPVSDARAAYKNGFNGGAFVRLELGKLPLSLRADLSYQNFELRRAAIPDSGASSGGTGTLLGGLGNVQVYFGGGS